MAKYAYVLFNICVASSLICAVLWVPEFWQRWRGLVRSFAAVSLPFIVWDIFATREGHWHFNQEYTLGARLFGLPLEEILFFVTVPLGCMVVWVLLDRAYRAKKPQLFYPNIARVSLIVIAGVLAASATAAENKTYTRLALIAAAGTCIVLAWRSQQVVTKQFMAFQVCGFSLFFVCNTVLTGLPIVTYGAAVVTGWRVGSIPVEDFLYNFAFVNLFLTVFLTDNKAVSKTNISKVS